MPNELRKKLGLGTGDTVAIYCMDNGTVILHVVEKRKESEMTTLVID